MRRSGCDSPSEGEQAGGQFGIFFFKAGVAIYDFVFFFVFFYIIASQFEVAQCKKKKGCIWWQFPSSRDSQAGSSVSVLTVNSAVPFWNKWPLVKSQRWVGGGGGVPRQILHKA